MEASRKIQVRSYLLTKRVAYISALLCILVSLGVYGLQWKNRSKSSRSDIRIRLVQPDRGNRNLLEIHITNKGEEPFIFLDVREGTGGVSELYKIIYKTSSGFIKSIGDGYSTGGGPWPREIKVGETYVREICPQNYSTNHPYQPEAWSFTESYTVAVKYVVTGVERKYAVARVEQRVNPAKIRSIIKNSQNKAISEIIPRKEFYRKYVPEVDIDFEFQTNFVTIEPLNETANNQSHRTAGTRSGGL